MRTGWNILLLALLVVLVPALVGSGFDLRGALDPAGPAAAAVNRLTWGMVIVGTLIFLFVLAMLAPALQHRSRGDGPDTSPPPPMDGDVDARTDRGMRNLIIGGGVVLPIVTAVAVVSASMYVSGETERPERLQHAGSTANGLAVAGDDAAPDDATPPPARLQHASPALVMRSSNDDEEGLSVRVVGRRWWWEVEYVDADGSQVLETANEIVIPAGQPVRFLLTSNDVIHSFWVPRLGGKTDLNPRRLSAAWLMADEPGEYPGRCAEFCGLQHAHMLFRVFAVDAGQFDEWLAAAREPAPEPQTQQARRGQELFIGAGCGACHSIAGLEGAAGELGPDLTHVGSRTTLAAGVVENTPDNMARWLAEPQAVKPGTLMPDLDLTDEQVDQLVAYLQGLDRGANG